MAAGDLTTLDNVKAWLKVSQPTDDDLLARLITAASSFVQTWINRTIAQATYTDTLDGTGGSAMLLRNAPVASITSLTVDGNAVAAAAGLCDAGYRLAGRKLILNTGVFCRLPGNVVVTYVAGYATTPPELEQAVIELIGLRYRERERIGQISETLAGQTVAYFIGDMPASVKAVLMQYREVVPV